MQNIVELTMLAALFFNIIAVLLGLLLRMYIPITMAEGFTDTTVQCSHCL